MLKTQHRSLVACAFTVASLERAGEQRSVTAPVGHRSETATHTKHESRENNYKLKSNQFRDFAFQRHRSRIQRRQVFDECLRLAHVCIDIFAKSTHRAPEHGTSHWLKQTHQCKVENRRSISMQRHTYRFQANRQLVTFDVATKHLLVAVGTSAHSHLTGVSLVVFLIFKHDCCRTQSTGDGSFDATVLMSLQITTLANKQTVPVPSEFKTKVKTKVKTRVKTKHSLTCIQHLRKRTQRDAWIAIGHLIPFRQWLGTHQQH